MVVLERLVPENGVEPSRPCGHWILSPARLPVPPLGHVEILHDTRLLPKARIGELGVGAMQPCPLQKKINKFRGTPSTGRPSGPASEVASRVAFVRDCRSQ